MHKTNYMGVIGGMGAKATAVFFERIISATNAEKDQDHLDLMILNHATLPDRTEVIMKQEKNRFLEAVQEDFRLLELAGVEYAAIPCNSAHYFYDEMQEQTRVKIINMVEETALAAKKRWGEGSKVALLATDGTVSSGMYHQYFARHGMEILVPEKKDQERIMDVIYFNIKGHLDLSPGEIESIIAAFIGEKGCRGVIVGCTELSCLEFSEQYQPYIIDAMQVLVETTIALSEKKKA